MGDSDSGGIGCGRVFWMLYGLTDVIFDCITAAAIHALPHPQGGDETYLGLSILLGLMSIVSFVGVDCILAISTDGSKGYEGSSSLTKGASALVTVARCANDVRRCNHRLRHFTRWRRLDV